MKRPWEVLAAGYVLGELAAGAGISAQAAAVMLTVCFVLLFLEDDEVFGRHRASVDHEGTETGSAGAAEAGRKRRTGLRAAALLLLPAFLLGMVRMSVELRAMPAALQTTAEGKYSFRIDAMEQKNGQRILTCGDTLLYVPEGLRGWTEKDRESGGAAEVSGAVESGTAALKIGNRIEVSGKLSAFPAAANPGQFDAASYYRAKGLRRRMYVRSFRITDSRCAPVRDFLYRTRTFCISLLSRGCEAEDAAFLSAVLFGDRSGLDEDFLQRYRKNGIAHLLAISGLHVSILGMGFYHSLRKKGLSFAASGGLAGSFLVLYGLLTGAGTSVTRAVIMLLLLFLAEWEGRTYDLRTAACIAAAAQLLVHPFELYQCGFQLSFLAVLAIGGPADTLIRGFEVRNDLLKSLIVSLSVTLCTLPVIAYWFFEVPVYAPFLNLAVIPLMGWILSAGLLVLLFSVLWFSAVSGAGTLPSAALPKIWYFCLRTAEGVVHRLLQVNAFLCGLTERIPGARVLTGRPAPLQILAFAFLLCGSFAWICRILKLRALRKEEERRAAEEEIVIRRTRPGAERRGAGRNRTGQTRTGETRTGETRTGRTRLGRDRRFLENVLTDPKKCLASAAAFLLAAVLCLAPHRPRRPELWFLDVGQGDGIAVLYRDSCVLIDGGSSSEKNPGKYILEPFLKSRAVSCVETVFLTHADQDHVNGIEYLLSAQDGPEIRRVVLNGAAETDPAYEELKKEIRAGGADLRYLGAGERMGFFRCLWPRRGTRDPDINEQSLVLLFAFGENRVLFTGDAGRTSEPGILRELSEAGLPESAGIDILKAGHHGSSTSSGREFLQALRPACTVISCGRNNRYGHPHRETVEALEAVGTEIYSTPVCGAIQAILDGERVKIRTYRECSRKHEPIRRPMWSW